MSWPRSRPAVTPMMCSSIAKRHRVYVSCGEGRGRCARAEPKPAIGGSRACRRYRERAPRCSSPSSTGCLWRCGRGRMSRRRFGCSGRRHEGGRSAPRRWLAAAVLACWCGAAEAYRPFDGTDAAVAETGEMEIELGPVEYLREGAERTLLAPDVRINYGFTPGWEAALEGKVAHGLTAGIPGTSLVESERSAQRRAARGQPAGEARAQYRNRIRRSVAGDQ